MANSVGLDVSQKTTAICVVDPTAEERSDKGVGALFGDPDA